MDDLIEALMEADENGIVTCPLCGESMEPDCEQCPECGQDNPMKGYI